MPPDNQEPNTGYDSDNPDEESVGSVHAHDEFNRPTSSLGKAEAGEDQPEQDGDNDGAKSLPGTKLAAAEAGSLFTAEGGAFETDAGGRFRGGVKQLVRGKAFRRSATTAGLLAGLLGGGLFWFTILIGPAQLIHLSHILQKPAGNEQDATASRTGKLIRWAKTGNYGETRLGFIGSRINKSVIAEFKAKGVTFETGDFGFLKSGTIDTAKYDKYQGLDTEQARAAIASDQGISIDSVKDAGPGKFSVSLSDTASSRGFIKNISGDLLDNGKILTALKLRQVFDYFGTPSWLHPINRIGTAGDNALRGTDAYTKLSDWAKERVSRVTKPTPAAAALDAAETSELSSLKSAAGAAKSATGVLLIGTSAICVAKDIAQKVPELNRANVAVQAMHDASDGIGLGAQAQYGGQDSSMAQFGAVVNSFTDPKTGKTIWASQPLNSLQDMPGGTDINSDIKPAFAPTNTAASLETTISNDGGDAVCSTLGEIAAGVIGIALIASGPEGWVFKSVVGLGSAAVGTAAVVGLMNYLPKLLSDKPITGVPHQGPEGGSVDAYGARELANSNFRNSGAVEMGDSDTLALDKQQQADQQATLNSESIADRVFNPYNENSAVGHLANDLSPSYTRNLAIIGDSLPHIGSSIVSSIASLVSPKAHAQAGDATYQWPFPEYAFSPSQLTDPAYEDPYGNAQSVATVLGNDSPDDLSALNKRTEACFGVSITKDSTGLWNATADSDTNPASADYQNSDCASTVKFWTQVRFFIFDTRTATAMDCYDGSADSCQAIGINSDGTSTGAATTSSIGQTEWPFKADVPVTAIQCFHDPLTGGTHPGIDLDAAEGTPIYAITAGTVRVDNTGDKTNYGPYYVTVNPDSASGFGSGYGHMDAATVTPGQHVDIGDQVGVLGSRGDSTGPHLHLNLFPGPYSGGDGPNIDPWPSLKPPPGTLNPHGCT